MERLEQIPQEKIPVLVELNGTVLVKAFSPYIGTDGYWYVFDDMSKSYVRTDTVAHGKDGDDGISPVVTITRTATSNLLSITDKEGTKETVIPDGFSPDIEVRRIDDKRTALLIAMKDHTETVVINDGEDGEDGNDYVLTDADRQEIAGMVAVPEELYIVAVTNGRASAVPPAVFTAFNSGRTPILKYGGMIYSLAFINPQMAVFAGINSNGTTKIVRFGVDTVIAESEITSEVPTADIRANTAARHNHTNKSAIDTVTLETINNWDNGSIEYVSLSDYMITNRNPLTYELDSDAISRNLNGIIRLEHEDGTSYIVQRQVDLAGNVILAGKKASPIMGGVVGEEPSVVGYELVDVLFSYDNGTLTKLAIDTTSTDMHIESLINSKLGVIENGTY